jgi:hypothetical protein
MAELQHANEGRCAKAVRYYARRVFTEGFGTFLLVSVDAGGAVVSVLSGNDVASIARSFATGLTVMALVCATGDVFGAHFNPCVTLAFALRRVFPWRNVVGSWGAQLNGSRSGGGSSPGRLRLRRPPWRDLPPFQRAPSGHYGGVPDVSPLFCDSSDHNASPSRWASHGYCSPSGYLPVADLQWDQARRRW